MYNIQYDNIYYLWVARYNDTVMKNYIWSIHLTRWFCFHIVMYCASLCRLISIYCISFAISKVFTIETFSIRCLPIFLHFFFLFFLSTSEMASEFLFFCYSFFFILVVYRRISLSAFQPLKHALTTMWDAIAMDGDS